VTSKEQVMAACDEAVRACLQMSREAISGLRARDGGAPATGAPGLAGEPGPDAVEDRAAGEPDESPDSGAGWVAAALPPPPARVLDAGCGDGALSAWLAALGYRVTAIDVDPAAVAAARAAGVPAVRADLASYEDEPFDVVVMLLSLHHMHPLAAVLDRVAHLVRPGGRLILGEFAWDWADPATIRWFYDIAAILAAAGVTEPLAGGDDPAIRWRAQHVRDGTLCNGGDAMIGAVCARFSDVSVHPVPYLARHLLAGRDTPRVFAELARIECEHLADGTVSATGFRLTARKDLT
jgi:SAM-dependent methyltransferase